MRKNCARVVYNYWKTWVQTALLMNTNFTNRVGMCLSRVFIPSLYRFPYTLFPQVKCAHSPLLYSRLSTSSTGLTKTTTNYLKDIYQGVI
jgi:hypothetical protein